VSGRKEDGQNKQAEDVQKAAEEAAQYQRKMSISLLR